MKCNCGMMISFQPETGIHCYPISCGEITDEVISFLVDEYGFPSPHKGKASDKRWYKGNYGYLKNRKGEDYMPIDQRCMFSVEKLASKTDLLRLMREKGAADPRLQQQVESVSRVSNDSIFLF